MNSSNLKQIVTALKLITMSNSEYHNSTNSKARSSPKRYDRHRYVFLSTDMMLIDQHKKFPHVALHSYRFVLMVMEILSSRLTSNNHFTKLKPYLMWSYNPEADCPCLNSIKAWNSSSTNSTNSKAGSSPKRCNRHLYVFLSMDMVLIDQHKILPSCCTSILQACIDGYGNCKLTVKHQQTTSRSSSHIWYGARFFKLEPHWHCLNLIKRKFWIPQFHQFFGKKQP